MGRDLAWLRVVARRAGGVSGAVAAPHLASVLPQVRGLPVRVDDGVALQGLRRLTDQATGRESDG